MPRGGKQRNRTNKQAITSAAKRQRALALRVKGWTFPMIAAEMKCGVSEAFRCVREGIRDTYREEAKELATLECEKYDALEREIIAEMKVAAPEQKPALFNSRIRLADRRAKLLGLDQPKQVEIIKPDRIEVVRVDDWAGTGEGEPAGHA